MGFRQHAEAFLGRFWMVAKGELAPTPCMMNAHNVLEVFFGIHRIPIGFFPQISHVAGRCEDWYNTSGPPLTSRGRTESVLATAELNAAILNMQLGHWHVEAPTKARPAALVLKVWRAMVGKDSSVPLRLPWLVNK